MNRDRSGCLRCKLRVYLHTLRALIDYHDPQQPPGHLGIVLQGPKIGQQRVRTVVRAISRHQSHFSGQNTVGPPRSRVQGQGTAACQQLEVEGPLLARMHLGGRHLDAELLLFTGNMDA